MMKIMRYNHHDDNNFDNDNNADILVVDHTVNHFDGHSSLLVTMLLKLCLSFIVCLLFYDAFLSICNKEILIFILCKRTF